MAMVKVMPDGPVYLDRSFEVPVAQGKVIELGAGSIPHIVTKVEEAENEAGMIQQIVEVERLPDSVEFTLDGWL
ncbi:hypothetical protein [Sphingomonas parapaucimobilis]|uniref:hypothetical protein n=1 Tax=Sphingomonas parapaucimobilis TaxID=28213 RepID=UPI00321AE2FF